MVKLRGFPLIYFVLCIFLSTGLASIAKADMRMERAIVPEARYTFLRLEEGPWEISILEADRKAPDLRLDSSLANYTVSGSLPLSLIAGLTPAESGYVLGAINGDFFSRYTGVYSGDPQGLHVTDGELVSFPHQARSSLVLGKDGQLAIERVFVRAAAKSSRGLWRTIHGLNEGREAQRLVLFTARFGETTGTNPYGAEAILVTKAARLEAGTPIKGKIVEIRNAGNSTIPKNGMVLSGHGTSAWFIGQLEVGEEVEISVDLDSATAVVEEAIGGGPRLLREGQVTVEDRLESFAPLFAVRRHPRTAVGFNAEKIFFVTVDGRRPQASEGMTLYELAAFMARLGCREALNLDGGGSTEMLVKGRLMNLPSDGKERPVANGLLLVSERPRGVPVAMAIEPSRGHLLAGRQLQFESYFFDRYGEPCRPPEGGIEWKVMPQEAGKISPEGRLQLTGEISTPQEIEIEAQSAAGKSKSKITVYPMPRELKIVPKKVRLVAGEAQQFVVEANESGGSDIPPLLLKPHWTVSGNIGRIDDAGLLRAVGPGGKIKVWARLGEAQGEAEVEIAGH